MGSTKNNCRLLLDVGGTFLKSAVADAAGQLLPGSEFSCPVRSEGSRAEIEGSLATTVARGTAFAAERGMELAGIGIAIPGPFDYAAGIPRMTHKFRSIYGVDLRGVLHAMPGVPADAEIRFMQDVNAALAGEIARGNAAGYGASALVSLGTGLGFSLSRDGRVLCNPAGGPKVVIFDLPYRDGILEQQPTLVNLQCDVDHPTQCMADMLHIIHEFGGVENLKGKKIAMTWAYSPSYGKPLSVPQGVIGLMSRFGMDVVLAHPEGYEVMPEVEEIAKKNAAATGGSYKKVSTMEEAFDGADIVYPKSWAPFAAMEQRTKLYQAGDQAGIDALEKQLLAQNAQHKDWTCSEEMMKRTKNGKALYLHCLPADINDVSCVDGEVEASVFDRYRDPLYKEASFKPYIIAAMIFLAKVKDPQATLKALEERAAARWFQK